MNAVLDAFAGMTPGVALFWMLVENVAIFALSLALGQVLLMAFRSRRVGPAPGPVDAREVLLAASCVGLNTVVTLAGWWLWKSGYITIRRDAGPRVWVDVLVLLLLMDLGMYLTHRLSHLPRIFRLIHATHHEYRNPRPLDLFVLNPMEVFGFGGLWLAVIWLYPSSWLGIVIYLALNLLFGTIGHLGVEPLPPSWTKLPILRFVGTSTFHAGHHHDDRGNFGFYTLIWDRLFGTLHPG